jgi:small conductance mechanosensitive channel
MDQEQINKLIEFATAYGLRIIAAILILVIGRWIAKLLTKSVRKLMEKKEVDPALTSFITSLLYAVLLIIVVLAAISKIGIQTTSFIAILGAAGLAVGLSLQGSLSNFAAGVLIMIFRPFKIGDFIDAGGAQGIVEEIGILVTEMRSPDNKKIIVPNAGIMSGNITNITAKDTRRCDMDFGVSYTDDLDKVESILMEMIKADDRVLEDPEPQVVVAELGDSSINFKVRPWVKKEDYWGLFFDMQKAVKQRFDKEGISIPFPQRDVHLFQESTGG